MFQSIGELIGALALIGFGALAIFRPHQLVSREDTPDQIKKRIKIMKRSGYILVFVGIGQLVFALVGA